MEQNKSYVVTDKLRENFRSSIEGCIPDLIDVGDRTVDPCPSDYRDNIRDYVGDRSIDMFPNIPDEDRQALIDWVTDYFCGKQEEDDYPACPCHDHTFAVSDLELSDDDKIRIGEAEAGCGLGMPAEDVEKQDDDYPACPCHDHMEDL